MAKHTQGDWSERDGIIYPPDDCDGHVWIADLRGATNTKANAKLISAAPDLLEALKAMQKAFNQLLPGIGNIACQDYANINEAPILAARAISKATGQ